MKIQFSDHYRASFPSTGWSASEGDNKLEGNELLHEQIGTGQGDFEVKEGRFTLDIGNFFTERIVRCWHRLLRKAVGAVFTDVC